MIRGHFLKFFSERSRLFITSLYLFLNLPILFFKSLDVSIVLLQSLINFSLDLFSHSDVHVEFIQSSDGYEDYDHSYKNYQEMRRRHACTFGAGLACAISLEFANSGLDCADVQKYRSFVDQTDRMGLDLLFYIGLSFLEKVDIVINEMLSAKK